MFRDFSDISGWADWFDVFPEAKSWEGTLDAEFAEFCRSGEHSDQSTESDVAGLLYALVRMSKAKTVIEVGVYQGAASLHLARGLIDNGGGELHLVDISQELLNGVQRKVQDKGLKLSLKLHCGDSAEIAKRGKLPRADLVFLDADHRYAPIQRDIVGYLPLVTNGGVLVLHDTVMWEGARRSATEFLAAGHKVITLASSCGSGVSIVRKL